MKRLLLITYDRPESGYGGGERTISIYKALSRLGEVSTLYLDRGWVPFKARQGEEVVRMLDWTEHDRWYWQKKAYLLRDYRPDRCVSQAVHALHRKHKFDAIFGRYSTPILGSCASLTPSFIDLDNQVSEPVPRFLPMRFKNAVLRRGLSGFKCVFVTRKEDIARVPHPDVRVLPCISSQPYLVPRSGDRGIGRRILFVGGFGHPPNRDGLMRFIRESLPSIRRHLPNTVLRAVGEGTDSLQGQDEVEGLGFVDHLNQEYFDADVIICPIWGGGGASVKLAEAAGFGGAIVATRYAASGFEGILEPGRDLLAANTDEGLANYCVELLKDGAKRSRMGERARVVASTMLSQGTIDRIIEESVGPWLGVPGTPYVTARDQNWPGT
jgi:glycosyltransferase involved in cell wall biosynthesis